jgi:hypothetical protein
MVFEVFDNPRPEVLTLVLSGGLAQDDKATVRF